MILLKKQSVRPMLHQTRILLTNIMKPFNNMFAQRSAHAQLVMILLPKSSGVLMMKLPSMNGEEPRKLKTKEKTKVFTGSSQLRLIRRAMLPGENAMMEYLRPNRNKLMLMMKMPRKLRNSLSKVV